MIDMQALVDGLGAKWQKERSKTQLTLGGLISKLEAMPSDTSVAGLGELMSYRGYYSDLAFEPSEESESVESLLNRCRGAMGKIYEGYKSGDYMMGESTPLWLSDFGAASGLRLMDISENGEVITAPEEAK